MTDPLRGEKNRRHFATHKKLMLRADLVADQYAHTFFNAVDQAIEDAWGKVEAKRVSDNAERKAA
jgi:hypothetical protein